MPHPQVVKLLLWQDTTWSLLFLLKGNDAHQSHPFFLYIVIILTRTHATQVEVDRRGRSHTEIYLSSHVEEEWTQAQEMLPIALKPLVLEKGWPKKGSKLVELFHHNTGNLCRKKTSIH